MLTPKGIQPGRRERSLTLAVSPPASWQVVSVSVPARQEGTMNHTLYAIALMRRDELLRQAAEHRLATTPASSVDGALSAAAARQPHKPRRLRRPRFVYRWREPARATKTTSATTTERRLSGRF